APDRLTPGAGGRAPGAAWEAGGLVGRTGAVGVAVYQLPAAVGVPEQLRDTQLHGDRLRVVAQVRLNVLESGPEGKIACRFGLEDVQAAGAIGRKSLGVAVVSRLHF